MLAVDCPLCRNLESSSGVPLDELIQLTIHLMDFRTTEQRSEEHERCKRFLTTWCEDNGMALETYPHALYIGPIQKNSPLLLLTHTDVVDGPEVMFAPLLCGEQLYGRGAIDDKYAVALSLILFRNTLRQLEEQGKTQEDMPIMLLITSDHEQGSKQSAQQVLPLLKPEFCILLDGGSPKSAILLEKGSISLEMRSNGFSAHSALPWLGTNAINVMMSDYIALTSYFRNRFPTIPPDYWNPTMNLCMVQAGIDTTQVPDVALSYFDIRFTEKESPSDLVQELRKKVNSSLAILQIDLPFTSLPSRWRDIFFELSGASGGHGHGSSDARFLTNLGISCVTWGADGDNSLHGPGEHINIPSIIPVYKTLLALIETALSA